MPGGLFSLMGGDLDWKMETVPQKHLNNRVLPLCRGKLLGGSSAFNGTLCIRGHKRDYDEWGLPGWSGEEVFGCMKKVSQSMIEFLVEMMLARVAADDFRPRPSTESHGSVPKTQSTELMDHFTLSRRKCRL